MKSYSTLAYIWKHTKQYTLAEPLYNDILMYYLSNPNHGPNSNVTMDCMVELAMVEYHMKQYDIATTILRTCLG